jgi:hypothetical protein
MLRLLTGIQSLAVKHRATVRQSFIQNYLREMIYCHVLIWLQCSFQVVITNRFGRRA